MRIIVKKVHQAPRASGRRLHKTTAAFAAAAVALLAVRAAAGSGGMAALPTASVSRTAESTQGSGGAPETRSSDVVITTEDTTSATTATLPRSGGTTTAVPAQTEAAESSATTTTESIPATTTQHSAAAAKKTSPEKENQHDSLTVDEELEDLLLDEEEIDSGISATYDGKLDVPANVRLDRIDFGSDFVKPLKRGRITSRFDYRVNPVTGRYVFHTGMDLGAASGSDIMAMKAGKVISAKTSGGYGKCVILEHENGVRTLYAHCSRLLVKAGERVRKGQVIALVGSTGNSTGPHLHIEFRKGGKRYDPEWVLGGIYN